MKCKKRRELRSFMFRVCHVGVCIVSLLMEMKWQEVLGR